MSKYHQWKYIDWLRQLSIICQLWKLRLVNVKDGRRWIFGVNNIFNLTFLNTFLTLHLDQTIKHQFFNYPNVKQVLTSGGRGTIVIFLFKTNQWQGADNWCCYPLNKYFYISINLLTKNFHHFIILHIRHRRQLQTASLYLTPHLNPSAGQN